MDALHIALYVIGGLLAVSVIFGAFKFVPHVNEHKRNKHQQSLKTKEQTETPQPPVTPTPEQSQPVNLVEQSAPILDAPVVVTDVADDTEDDRERARRIPFAEKMLYIDKKTQGYYNQLMNKFRSLRKINIRISSKGVSYRLGRELVAKITVRGKTMKLHLALDVNSIDANIFFQKDLSDVKSYAEVPCTVKVKSDRGLKNALVLVDKLIESKGIEKKTRFTETDGIEDLKAIAVKTRV